MEDHDARFELLDTLFETLLILRQRSIPVYFSYNGLIF